MILLLICIFIVFYTYGGYGILLYSLNQIIPKKHKKGNFTPPVTVIIACYNEEKWIEKKFFNIEGLEYPNNIEVIWITDGSTDKTNDILNKLIIQDTKYDHQLLWESARKGKTAALNRAMKYVTNNFVVFTDCNTMTNPKSVSEIIKNFRDQKVGAVSGEKQVVGGGEGLYWKYENFLKHQGSLFWTQVGTPGELFALRKDLYQEPKYDTILDDFIISMKICEQGYRVILEPNAVAIETGSIDSDSEWIRRRRISAGGIQSIIRLSSMLLPWKTNIRTWFQYLSHKVFRWTVAPICYFLIPFIISFNLITSSFSVMWILIFETMIIYIGFVLIGWKLTRKNIGSFLVIPYYFTRMNWCVIEGIKKYFTESGIHVWKKVDR